MAGSATVTDSRRGGHEAQRSGKQRAGIALVLVAGLVLVAEAGLRWRLAREQSFDPDEFHHLQRAWLVSEGRIPYVDFYDHHGPLVHLLGAPILALASPESAPERAAEVFRTGRVVGWAVSCLLILATFHLATRFGGVEAGLVAAVLLSGVGIAAGKAIEIRPDGVSLVLWLESLRFSLAGPERPARRFAAGVLAGLALSANLKLAVALPALLAPIPFEPRRGRSLVLLSAGGLLGIAPVALALTALGAIDDFAREALLGSVSGIRTLSPWRFMETLAGENPEILVLGLGGLLGTIVRLPRSPTAASDATIAAAAGLPLAAVFAIPEPWAQSFLLFLPALAVLAARPIVAFAACAAERRRTPILRSVLIAALVLTAAASAAPRLAAPPRWDNRGHLAWIRWLVSETPREAVVLAGWGSPAVFREPATWRPFHPIAWIARMSEDERRGVAALVEDPVSRPDVVFLDAYLDRLSPRIPEVVRERYRPTGMGGAWVPREPRAPPTGMPAAPPSWWPR